MKMNILKKTVAACSVAAFMAVGCVSVAQAHTSRFTDTYGETNASDRLQGTPSGYGPDSLHGGDIQWVTDGWTAKVGCASFDTTGNLTKADSVPTLDPGSLNKNSGLMCMKGTNEDQTARLVFAPSTPNGVSSGWNRIIYCLSDVTSFKPGSMTYDTNSHTATCKAPSQITISL